MTTGAIDEAHLRQWIGREEVAEDVLTESLAARFQATLALPGEAARTGQVAPRLIHFCLCQPAVPTDELGEDGHPALTGEFLPPVPLPRRMWAASEIEFSGDVRVGEDVRRRSRIADVAVKHGRSGTLCFVNVEHEISTGGKVVVFDRQSIVYREATPAPVPGSPPPELPRANPPAPAGEVSAIVDATSALLFRYSAITFNSHRIHYDLPYATGEEGYPALVVQGPLQATLLLHFAARCREGRPPDRFAFRAQSPLFAPGQVELHCGADGNGELSLWTCRPGGPVAMSATAVWR